MFVVDDILISDAIPQVRFACDLAACHGACCVQGEAGAPLEPDERAALDRLLPAVEEDLRPEARAAIAERGAWEETAPGAYATTCVEAPNGESGACVFVTYDGPVALCALQKARQEGRLPNASSGAFAKPISCHLFPLRVERHGPYDVLNYEQVSLCTPARTKGATEGMRLADVARAPLVRKYGADWYARFRDACAQRETTSGGPNPPCSPSDSTQPA